ncbi:hypothetical protein ACH436_01820 [Isoptericola sp. NPDC019693]|uniref:hypothetical protein n=1 Tax=Isoptericola sp. NPDC019693 TaxID=3364009 RepID=UPI0037BDF4FB
MTTPQSPASPPNAPTIPVHVPRPQQAASLVGMGLLLILVGLVLTSAGMVSPLAVVGLMAFAGGGLALVFGVHRAVRNLDSIAAAKYNESLRHED